MDEQDKIVYFYKKKIEPFIAIFILTFLIVGCILLYQDNILKGEIKENCGYETKKIVCYCEQKVIDSQMAIQKNGGLGLDAKMDWINYSESSD